MSPDGNDGIAGEVAGFSFISRNVEASRTPLLLLHGSGQSETWLIDFARSIAPDRSFVAIRGKVPWEDGFAFFRRHPDRSLDLDDLACRAEEICALLRNQADIAGRKPVLVGYSNGAIMAAAIAARDASLISGAILLRPLSPQPSRAFPKLRSLPLLLIAGSRDTRRHPSDAGHLAAQLTEAGADVAFQTLACGHGWDETGADAQIAHEWLQTRIS